MAVPMLFGIARNPAALGSGAMPMAEGSDLVREQGEYSRLSLELVKHIPVLAAQRLVVRRPPQGRFVLICLKPAVYICSDLLSRFLT